MLCIDHMQRQAVDLLSASGRLRDFSFSLFQESCDRNSDLYDWLIFISLVGVDKNAIEGGAAQEIR